MATETRSGSGLRGVLLLCGVIAAGWVFVNIGNHGGLGIYPPGDEDDPRRVVLIVNWSHPVNRKVTTTYWINGQRHDGHDDPLLSTEGEWRDWLEEPVGTRIRLLAENGSQGGRLSCFIFEGPPGNEILVREQHRVELDAGDCDIEHRVGDPPDVEPFD